jgi:hypothetical protein
MKTVALTRDACGTVVTLELNEVELTTLVALVEQGQRHLGNSQSQRALHAGMQGIANEFCSLLGHLELLPADD